MTILNQTLEHIQIGEIYNFSSPLFILVMSIGAILSILAIVFIAKEGDLGLGIMTGIVSFIIVGFAGVSAIAREPIYKDIPQYEVTIDEDANFYDILDTYDIIEQRGKIFILRDKNWEDNT